MGKKEDVFLKKLLEAFKIESEDHLKAISSGLLELEKMPEAEEQRTVIETVFREAHSLKGAARAVNMPDIEAVCRSLEDIFAVWKRQELELSPELFDTLHHTLDAVGKLLSSPSEMGAGVSELIKQLDLLKSGEGGRETGAEDYTPGQTKDQLLRKDVPLPEEKPAGFKTVRISTDRLVSLLLQTEQMLAVKMAMEQRAADIRDILSHLDIWKKEWMKVYPEVQRVRQLFDRNTRKNDQVFPMFRFTGLFKFLDWNLTHLKSFEEKLTCLSGSAEQDRRSLGGMLDNLLEDMKKSMMLPFSYLMEIFPRLIRDISREQGKKVKFSARGGEVEVDRRVLEEIRDPLIHLVRNCIDHGIEKPDERKLGKKSLQGTVAIAVAQVSSSRIEINISDDGRGIDLAGVGESAVKGGAVLENDINRLTEQEILSLIFKPGLTTSPIITDISGRGLGLAIVQEKVVKLGGSLSIETAPHTGTSFRIILPVTIATFRGVLVMVADRIFIVPVTHVKQAVRIKKCDVKTVENRETISLKGRTLSLVGLDEVLELTRGGNAGESPEFIPVLVLAAGEKCIGFRVDEVLSEQEVLVKSLGRQLSRVRNITGAAILASGSVAPILNVADLMKSAVKVIAAPVRASAAAEEAESEIKSILVVEDSITSRMLLKNILEGAGYSVKTAVDGVDGFTTLREQGFDLVVSDIEMPRMNGFDLTAKIRADRKLNDLPVVMVTAMESRADRERGIDVGASAYIVKSSFDHSNLLDVIRRLI